MGGKRQLALILLLGLAIRIVWMILGGATWQSLDVGEAMHAASSFARDGRIADGFFPGQGPTAHMLPTMIVIAGTIMRLFGPDSPLANLMLAAWALAQSFAAFLLIRTLFARIGTDRTALSAGLAILCLVPVLIAHEACDFRFWEGALALCLATCNLLLLERFDRQGFASGRGIALVACLSAITFFVSPPAGLAIDLCWATYALRNLPPRTTLAFATGSALALALVIAPWAIRNQRVMGEPIALRSNFWLETSIANHPAALSDAPRRAVWSQRMQAVHPFAGGEGATAFRAAGGELAYSRSLGAETRAWIRAHPVEFIRLSLRHYRQFYIPDRWEFGLTKWARPIGLRALLVQAVGVLGIAGLLWGLVQRRRFYGYIAIYVAAAGLPYALVQPIPRYGYLVYGIFVFLAAQLLVDAGRAIATVVARRRSGPALSAPASDGRLG